MNREAGAGHGIGAPVRRKEDGRLLTGVGQFSDDVALNGQAHAHILRSPHAHARITAIDCDKARRAPGVLAVLTAADAEADGLKPIPHHAFPNSPPDISLENRDGRPVFKSAHALLCRDTVRFVGEPVVLVVAESPALASDAAELVEVHYEPLPAVADAAVAAADGSTLVWPAAGSNVCLDAEVGDSGAVAGIFAGAAHVARLDTWINRVTGVPMEPRAALGDFNPAETRYTLYAGGGGVVRARRELAATLGVDQDRVRVIARDIGGNFGTRNSYYPEFTLVCWASARVGRPVKWRCERQEAFATDYQGRDLRVRAELALDRDGRFLALRGDLIGNIGAYAASFVPITKSVELLPSVYRIPVAHIAARAVYTNTPPTAPYRSAGRPEAMYVMERLIDLAAAEMGLDRVDIRRRNLIPPAALPFTNALGLTYDNGDYAAAMESALNMCDWSGFPARRARAERNGRLRGIGLANYIEATTGNPRERAEITVRPDRTVEVVIGTMASGQGHETSFAQVVAEWLGVEFGQVRLVTGDTERVSAGGGSHSGRSMRMASIVIGHATDAILNRARQLAAHCLEVAADDLEFAGGRFTVRGTDRALSLFEIAALSDTPAVPQEMRGPLCGISDEMIRVAAFPYGAAACEVEIDPDTGALDLVTYAAVDDVGRAVNPLILHGQTHGAVAQGIGQALLENCVYGPDGQLMAASFMDYAMPRASSLPQLSAELMETPSPTNRLGIRAGGEGGTTPALGAVMNAVADALRSHGIRHVEMPATPERIWNAIRAAQDGRKAG